MQHFELDETDKKILSFLISDARTPYLEIARECNISGAAIHQRVKKLEQAGIILGSGVHVKPQTLGYDICAFAGIQLSEANKYAEVIKALRHLPEIVECHFTTGSYAILIKMYCRNNEHLMHVLVNTIQNIPGIASTETFLSLEQTINRQIEIA